MIFVALFLIKFNFMSSFIDKLGVLPFKPEKFWKSLDKYITSPGGFGAMHSIKPM